MARTEFVHSVDAFSFVNSWNMQPADWDQLRGIIQGAATGITFHPLVNAIIGPLLFAVPPGPPISNVIIGKIVTDQIVANANPGTIGLCGGMAFAAADYFQLRWLTPRGQFASGTRNPGYATPEESVLRNYIWRRLIDSLTSGGVATQTLLWMAVARNIFPFSILGGTQWLKDRSREHFATIKHAIDAGRVCPIGLIGTTNNPMNNHQVLVTGYEDPGPWGPNSCRLFVYEPNGPDAERTIDFDFTGAHQPHEDQFQSDRGDLQGFFTSQYTPVTPPPAVVVTQGLRSSITTARVDQAVQLNMTLQNVGFGDTPPMRFVIGGMAAATNVDAGSEASPHGLAMHAARSVSLSPVIAAPTGARTYFAAASVEPGGTTRVRRVPAASASGHTSVDLFVTNPAPSWDTRGGIIRSAPAICRSSDGRMHIFAIGTDNNLWALSQTAPNSGWSGWARTHDIVPAGLSGRPFAMLDRQGLFHVFCHGLDRQIWHTRQLASNGPLQGWEALGGNSPNDPSATFNADGRLEAFIHQSDNTAAHRWINPTGWWPPFGNWESRGGNLLGAPALERNTDGRLEVFARFTDNTLRHQWQVSAGGGWSDWQPFGSGVTSEPTVGVNRDGRLEVFCVSGGTVWQRWQVSPGGNWSEWRNTQQPAAADCRMAVVTNTFGGLEVFVRSPQNVICTAGFRPGPTWTAWHSLGGTPYGDPAAGINLDGRVEVFVRGSDQSLQHRWQISPGHWE